MLVPWLFASELGTILAYLPPKSFAHIHLSPRRKSLPRPHLVTCYCGALNSLMYSFTYICIACEHVSCKYISLALLLRGLASGEGDRHKNIMIRDR